MKYRFIHVITLLKVGRFPRGRMQHKLGKTISKRINIDDNDVKKQTSKGLTPKEASAWVCDSGEIIFTTLKFTKTLNKKKNLVCYRLGFRSADRPVSAANSCKDKRDQMDITKEQNKKNGKGSFLERCGKM